jgi:hypothetical protein
MARTTKTTTKNGLFGKKRTTVTKTSSNPFSGGSTTAHHTGATTHHHTTAAGAPRRKVSMGDKLSGAMMKLRGSVTRRPGLKAAGTRRMNGTDGLGSHRVV